MKTINKNIPNIITVVRMILTPVVIALFLIPNGICKFLAFVIYAIASCTDFVDGYLARKYNLVSDIGKLLDSSADKFLQTSALILVLINSYNVVSEWISITLLLVILLRDCFMNALRQLCATKGAIVQADVWGKIKSILMDIAMGALFLYVALASVLKNGANTILFADLKLSYLCYFGVVLLAISAVFSVYSCINYTLNSWQYIVDNKKESTKNADNKNAEVE